MSGAGPRSGQAIWNSARLEFQTKESGANSERRGANSGAADPGFGVPE